ncbi:MAG: glucose 1-dehydrogenase [Victivallaceae bacterium]|nr:glucose 1-dehydrogenase [Victivallaceae bacterium]
MNAEKLFDLSGRVALITGGSKGIGYAVAQGFAMAGAAVALTSRHGAEAEQAAKSLEAFKVESLGIGADVKDLSQAQSTVLEITGRLGRLDILVNNAAAGSRKPALEVTEEFWDNILDTNLKAAFFWAQAAARQMVKQHKGGRIINISSVGAMVAQRENAPYGASKGGLNQLTRNLAVEWAGYNILVNAIAPGSIITEGNEKHLSNPKSIEHNLSKICLGRIGKPEEVIGAAVFLASEASSYVTGQILYVDGGWTIE